jgi:hypothetical protein
LRQREQLGEFSEVLGGGCEVEFVAGAVWATQSEPPEAKDAFEVGEQHLDLLPELARDCVLRGLSDGAGHVSGGLKD